MPTNLTFTEYINGSWGGRKDTHKFPSDFLTGTIGFRRKKSSLRAQN